MNYRHAFHAGNFADVVKHAVLARVLSHLLAKEAPFRVIDTHAGIGLYDLAGDEATRTGEWREGIGRLLQSPPGGAAGAFLAPYLDVVAALRAEHPGTYPGSPVLAAWMGRRQDRFLFNELHPEDAGRLAALFAADPRVKVTQVDAFQAVKAHLPPPERRGLVIIDPPFEEAGEFARMVRAFRDADRRFAGGVLAAWYPIKDRREVDAFHQALRDTGLDRLLVIEHWIRRPQAEGPLAGAGLVLRNPPWTLAEDAAAALPALADCLAVGPGAGCRVEWLVPEQPRGRG